MRKKGNFHIFQKTSKNEKFAKMIKKGQNTKLFFKKTIKKERKKERKKENGAHKHLSHCNFGEHKIFTSCFLLPSHHKNNKKHKKSELDVKIWLKSQCVFCLGAIFWVKKRKTEHTNIVHTAISESAKYSRHVVFCKKNKKSTNQKHN